MEKEDKELEEKIKELQLFEQNLNTILFQKQAFQLEQNEVASALEELKESKGDVFKIIGSVMIKTEKEKLKKELEEKQDLIELRLKNIEKQESVLKKRAEELRKSVLKRLK